MQGFYTILLLVVSNIFYDMCLVRPPEDETAVQLVRTFAVDRCNLIQLVSRFLRV